MRKICLFLCLLPTLVWAIEGTLQLRAGYFGLTSSWPRSIYGNGSVDLEVEGSIKLASSASFWTNLNYTWKNGHSTLFSHSTRLDLATLSAGFNLSTPVGSSPTRIYFGLGASGALAHTSDQSPFLSRHNTRFGVGFVAKSGFLIPCPHRLFVNPFFDYYYQPINARNNGVHRSINLNGFRTGLGLGLCF